MSRLLATRPQPWRGIGSLASIVALRNIWALTLCAVLACAAPGSTPSPAGGDQAGAGLRPSCNAERLSSAPGDRLVIWFFDVGQGDAVLIREPGGRSVLYDGGPAGADMAALLRRAGVDSLALMIASHNHADHIAGLAGAVREFRPAFFMDNGLPHTTRTYERVLEAVHASGARYLEPSRRELRLGEARLTILPPPGIPAWEQNDNSIGLLLEFGGFRASFFGDAGPRQFAWWLEHHGDAFMPVAMHKASHHGSRNGDVNAALDRLVPAVVVIGVGSSNPYGHPHPGALELYAAIGARVLRTDLHGTICLEASEDGSFEVFTDTGASAVTGPLAWIDTGAPSHNGSSGAGSSGSVPIVAH